MCLEPTLGGIVRPRYGVQLQVQAARIFTDNLRGLNRPVREQIAAIYRPPWPSLPVCFTLTGQGEAVCRGLFDNWWLLVVSDHPPVTARSWERREVAAG